MTYTSLFVTFDPVDKLVRTSVNQHSKHDYDDSVKCSEAHFCKLLSCYEVMNNVHYLFLWWFITLCVGFSLACCPTYLCSLAGNNYCCQIYLCTVLEADMGISSGGCNCSSSVKEKEVSNGLKWALFFESKYHTSW